MQIISTHVLTCRSCAYFVPQEEWTGQEGILINVPTRYILVPQYCAMELPAWIF